MKKKLPTKTKTSNGIYEYNVFDNLWGSKKRQVIMSLQ